MRKLFYGSWNLADIISRGLALREIATIIVEDESPILVNQRATTQRAIRFELGFINTLKLCERKKLEQS